MTDPSVSSQSNGIRGRWDLQRIDIHTYAWGEFPADGIKVPVVPCDGEAVDRVAQKLAGDLAWLWRLGVDDEILRAGAERTKARYREQARDLLRAAARGPLG